jgi:hypothetical protein
VVRDFNLAEVKSHAGDVLVDAMGRGQAAEVWRGFQGAGLDHKESRLSPSGGRVTSAGAAIIARKTKARMISWTI